MDKIRTINPEQLAVLFRTALQFGGGYLVGQGIVDAETWTVLSGALLTLAITLWGLWARKDSNLIKSAAAVPAVEKVVAPGVSAARDPDYPKVQSA